MDAGVPEIRMMPTMLQLLLLLLLLLLLMLLLLLLLPVSATATPPAAATKLLATPRNMRPAACLARGRAQIPANRLVDPTHSYRHTSSHCRILDRLAASLTDLPRGRNLQNMFECVVDLTMHELKAAEVEQQQCGRRLPR